jgi:NAD(P)-dependent dehydrogenase (short-subunit alcohol dehydrogenase family)
VTALAAGSLDGRRCLVTGGSRGIGAAIAGTLAQLGGDVIIAANDRDGLDETVATIKDARGSATAIFTDLMDPDSIAALTDAAGHVDVLVNNAAPDQQIMPFLDAPDALWERMLSLIVWAPIRLLRVIGRDMAQSGRGSIVNIASMSVDHPAPGTAPYAASKAALVLITKVLAMELGPSGVRSNAIAPSVVATERIAHLLDDPNFRARAVGMVPMGRLATPDDVASVAAWLASDASAFVNGQLICVDGGTTAGRYSAPPAVKAD